MTLSLILCSRNDHYMGDSRWRLETALNYVAERVQEIGPRARDAVEVLVADWGSEIPLRDVLRLTPAAARIVSFVTVPLSLARERQRDSPFPEVLALNAAARLARGAYIGRIDQDTLVGERFLRLFLEIVEGSRGLGRGRATPEAALLFSNRRSIPYRFAASTPSLRNVSRFVQLFGTGLKVWRDNPKTGVFWTSYVGIWLAHRNLWHECGGYDERLIYYNWMETDMICRLRRKYPTIDLGELTNYDFYHLDHHDPRGAPFARRHAMKNADVDPTAVPPVLHPNTTAWGLHGHSLALQATSTTPAGSVPGGTSLKEHVALARLTLRSVAGAAFDPVVIFWRVQARRAGLVRGELARKPVTRWAGSLRELWTKSHADSTRAIARPYSSRLRTAIAEASSAIGVLTLARGIRLRIELSTSGEIRGRERAERDYFSQFHEEYGRVLGARFNHGTTTGKRALVVSSRCPTVETELCLIKALQLGGFTPVVLLEDEQRALRPYYELAGVSEIHRSSAFSTPRYYGTTAAAVLSRCHTLEDLLGYAQGGVRVGRIAASTAIRQLRRGSLDLRSRDMRECLVRRVSSSLSSAADARNILRTVRPDLALFVSTEYTPKGELFDACIEEDLDVIAYDMAHKSNALMFKRYGRGNRECHLASLSEASWAHVRNLEWTESERDRLDHELTAGYAAGDWCGACPTPSRTRDAGSHALVRQLGLDPAKRTAVIFSHILWDSPLMWARTLFTTYEEWLIETLHAASANENLNWVVKIHPAHIRKRLKEGYQDEPAETRALRERLGTLPRHVVVIPPDTAVSTFSLFAAMDYCLTVRGTVGIEAARLGIPVLTAAMSRYDRRGFTIDSDSRAEYLRRVAHIDETPALSGQQRALAERFAYGLFVLRPLESSTWDAAGANAWVAARGGRPRARIKIHAESQWRQAPDMRALADWFVSGEEDFLNRG